MPLIRTRADIDDKLGGHLTAEAALMAACEAGEVCVLGDGTLPEKADATREVRADVLRYLIVGGCEKCLVADWGVRVQGAYVSGTVDLSFASAKGMTDLSACRFQQHIEMRQTSFEFLTLNGSHLIGLNAQGAGFTDSIVLSNIVATATVDLSGAEIGGQLDCTSAQMNVTEGQALTAQGAEVTDGVFLSNINAMATIDLNGTEIGGQLECTGARLNATEGDALTAQDAQVNGGLIWRNVSFPFRPVWFAAAHADNLDDFVGSWVNGGGYHLGGFSYDRIYGSTDAQARLPWLEEGSYEGRNFTPQPFTQLAKVLRESGHDGEARKVLFKREQLLRRNIRDQQRIEPNGDISVGLLSILRDIKNGFWYAIDLLLRWVVGYGHHPFQSLWLLIALIVLAICPAHLAYKEGSFAPNSGPIQASAEWQDYATIHGNPAAWWSEEGAPGQDWETFNRYAYAADLVIPIIDLGQTAAWAPSTTRGWWGKQLWWAQWFFIAMGWIVTALGAAAITGIIRRE